MKSEKIKTLGDLKTIAETLRKKGKRIVHCHGVFDLLHIGHIRYFDQASRMGDVLFVTVTPDIYVDKGAHRPAFTEVLRAEAIASLDKVDYVAINKWMTAEETLRILRPNVYVKGSEFKNIQSDMTGKISREEAVVSEIGAEIAFSDDIIFSSSNLINRYLSNFPQQVNQYLEFFRQRHNLEEIIAIIDNMSSLNVLVIGDVILDEYQYCNTLGKSSKDPALAMQYQSHDLFAGGVLAVSNHVANFAKSVRLVTLIGEKDSYEEFVRSQLHPAVTPMLHIKKGAPTLIKRRFVDGSSLNKLFEVYVMDDTPLPVEQDKEICMWLLDELPKYDLVIAADFGHGTISPAIIKTLIKHSKFLAVNTQANAGNRGFHTVSKYSLADYVCIAEHELRLEARTQNGGIRPVLTDVVKRIGAAKMVVTRSREGCAVLGEDGNFVQIPAFARKIVDRVGAGDAFLSVTSLAAVQGVENEVLGFLGNVVGGMAVEIVGNKKSIDNLSLKKSITSLMK